MTRNVYHRIIATLVSVAASTVPSASLTLIFLVLHAINAPVHDVGLLLAIDWLLYVPQLLIRTIYICNLFATIESNRDRVRTTNNILGDCYAAALVEHWSKTELQSMDGNNPNDPQEIRLEKLTPIQNCE